MVKATIVKPTILDEALKASASTVSEIDSMPLETYDDYMKYNEAARKQNKKLRINRHLIKPCPIELHEKLKVAVTNNDQPLADIPIFLSNDKIEYKETLSAGVPYELPRCVVEFLQDLSKPIYSQITKKDGSIETKPTGKLPRFSVRTFY